MDNGLDHTTAYSYCNDITSLQSNRIFYEIQFNSLAHGRFQFNFRQVIFKLTLVNGGWGISQHKSTLVQVMAWCHQASSHYLSQCWPRSMSPNRVTMPQWVKAHFVTVALFETLFAKHLHKELQIITLVSQLFNVISDLKDIPSPFTNNDTLTHHYVMEMELVLWILPNFSPVSQ